MTLPEPSTTDMGRTRLILSVSGMRGIVGESLTATDAARFAAAYGFHLRQLTRDQPPHVVIGRDSRPSGPMLEHAAVAGLVSVGCRVTRLGVVSTPGVAIMIDEARADGGMVVTASHNPTPWNGMKALGRDASAVSSDEMRGIIELFEGDESEHVGVERLQSIARDDSTDRRHANRVLERIDGRAIADRKLKVVLDSVHGAGGAEAALLLKDLGVETVHLFAEPTGRFPHAPEPLRENLQELCAAVKAHGADAGFAQDPDADRLAIVDEGGRYVGEEYTLALVCLQVLGTRTPSTATAVTNLSTSRLVDDVCQSFGGRVVRTPVGEAHVAAAIRRSGAPIGGEGNGGVIWPCISHVRDSLVGIGLVTELLARHAEPLSAIIDGLPAYTIVKEKVDATRDLIDTMGPSLRKHFAGQSVDLNDGVRVDWPDRWIHIRPSNTEPIVRMIAEARDGDTASKLIAEARGVLGIGS